jgi:hypothetical protein
MQVPFEATLPQKRCSKPREHQSLINGQNLLWMRTCQQQLSSRDRKEVLATALCEFDQPDDNEAQVRINLLYEQFMSIKE